MHRRCCLAVRGIRFISRGGRCSARLRGKADVPSPGSSPLQGHRVCRTVSSMGGERTYPWASAPSTWENMACVLSGRAPSGAQTTSSLTAREHREERHRVLESALRVDLKYHESSLLLTGSSGGFQVSSNSCTAFDRTLMSSSWRPEDSELPDCSGSDPAHSSFSEAEMDSGLVALLVAKGYESLDVGRGAETASGKGNRGMRRPLGSTARQDGAPAARRGGAHQRHAGGSEPHPEQGPRTTSRRARSTRTGRSAQSPQSDSSAPPRREPGPGRRRNGDADPAVRWVPAQILHTEAITNSR